MCFAIPLKVNKVTRDEVEMEDGRVVKLGLIGRVKTGDWLLVKSNLAVEKLDKKEAKKIRQIIKEVSDEIKL